MPVSIVLRLFVIVLAGAAITRVSANVIVDPQVSDAVASGPVRVIVELRTEGDFVPEGDLTESGVRVQRQAIAAAQDAVLSELGNRLGDGDVRLVRRLETVPFLALEIGARALAELSAMPDRVVRILKDDSAAAQRSQ